MVRETAQCGEVRSRTRVIMQSAGKLLRKDSNERYPQPFRGDNDRGRWSCFEHLADFWLLIAQVHQARWIRRGDDYVNVAHHGRAAPQTPCKTHLFDQRQAGQPLEEDIGPW